MLRTVILLWLAVSVNACTPMGPSESDVAESLDRTPSTKTTKRPTPNTEVKTIPPRPLFLCPRRLQRKHVRHR
ncbi:hypothetical protein QR680_011792 [Steinernema hermaphroditum]|uniref:Uncharacterized protein n=1 Tax=Steinernema hermaphroditum TaxID=289476 RepID=A0AA39LZC5_9BILA|nr:hypothetical protein QR680_011792 [Steinernema hermaphroditum]